MAGVVNAGPGAGRRPTLLSVANISRRPTLQSPTTGTGMENILPPPPPYSSVATSDHNSPPFTAVTSVDGSGGGSGCSGGSGGGTGGGVGSKRHYGVNSISWATDPLCDEQVPDDSHVPLDDSPLPDDSVDDDKNSH